MFNGNQSYCKHVECHSFLSSAEVPYFREFPENTTASEGETVYFTVSVAGNPEPTWLWTHMKEPLSSGGNIDIFPDGTLIIKNVCTDNSGIYQFIAKNAAGEISNHVTLEVLEEEEDDSYSQRSLFGSTTNILHQIIPIGALDSHVEMHHANENEGFNLRYNVSCTAYRTVYRCSNLYRY